MIHMKMLAAITAKVNMPAHCLRAASHDVFDGAAMRRHHPRTERIEVRRPKLAEYVRNFDRFHDTRQRQSNSGTEKPPTVSLSSLRAASVRCR